MSRRRFWRGNFLFSDDSTLGGPGFKRFRPVVLSQAGRGRAGRGRGIRPLSNAEIEQHPAYGDYSLEQYQKGIDGFYDAVQRVISPQPIEPERALLTMIQAFQEQVERRVLSVQNGVDYLKNRAPIDMPEGAEIFQTVGAWEDYSTPSRDMRLLIALDVVRGFPVRVERQPQRFAHSAGKSPTELRAELQALLEKETAKRTFHYVRTGGGKVELSLADIIARAEGFEMAYNPNDCPEKRWAAPVGSEEYSTCRRHAPAHQRARMKAYRRWFARRQRPVRN